MCQLPQCRRDGQAAVLKLNAGNGEADTAERCGRRDPRRPPGAQRSSGRCGAASLRFALCAALRAGGATAAPRGQRRAAGGSALG